MAMILKGRQLTKFKAQDGTELKGVNLQLMSQNPVNTEFIQGYTVDTVFVLSSKPTYDQLLDLPIDSIITIIRNKRGKYDDFILVSLPGDKSQQNSGK